MPLRFAVVCVIWLQMLQPDVPRSRSWVAVRSFYIQLLLLMLYSLDMICLLTLATAAAVSHTRQELTVRLSSVVQQREGNLSEGLRDWQPPPSLPPLTHAHIELASWCFCWLQYHWGSSRAVVIKTPLQRLFLPWEILRLQKTPATIWQPEEIRVCVCGACHGSLCA